MNDIRMQSLPTSLSPAEVKTGLEENFGPTRNEFVEHLKHSIKMHIVLMNGVSEQLCAYMLKLIDFLTDIDVDRKNREIAALSYSIIEASALYVSGTIDSFNEKFQADGREFSEEVRTLSNAILVQIGNNRGNKDKIAAKMNVLKATSDALNALSGFTGTQYARMVDLNGVPL